MANECSLVMGDTQLSKPSNITVLAEFFQRSSSVCPIYLKPTYNMRWKQLLFIGLGKIPQALLANAIEEALSSVGHCG